MIYKKTLLTTEQETAALAIISGSSATIQAPAGSGKTMTIAAGARRRTEKGLAISFNKSTALNASKIFNANIECKTSHSLAYREVGRHYRDRLKKLTGSSLSRAMNLGDIGAFPSMATKGYLVLDTIRAFCYSSSSTLSEKHVPYLTLALSHEKIHHMRQDLAEQAKLVWTEMSNRSSSLPITHDTYLKLWALTSPKLSKDFILFDEAQDANLVILDVILSQPEACQKVFIGDRYQQIYSWRGAVNAMAGMSFPRYNLTKSFRFGQEIATVANKILSSYSDPAQAILPITGLESKPSEVHTTHQIAPHCIICRTNQGVISATIASQLSGTKVHIQGGAKPILSLLSGIEALRSGKKPYHPELLLFKTFDSLVEYSESSMGASMKYLLKLIKDYSFKKLYAHLVNCYENPDQAEVTITTVHKAKGLEWPIVRLWNDFKHPDKDTPMISQEETNILYVAATRALNILDISSCSALSSKALGAGRDYWQGASNFLRKEIRSIEDIYTLHK